MGRHIALLGDSIFDNGAYTNGEPDVIGHLRAILPFPWKATLCAVDGSMVGGLAGQLERIPPDASPLVISVGGNDALMNIDMLSFPARSAEQVLELFGQRISQFEAAYRAAIHGAVSLGRVTTICTIYNGNLEPDFASRARIVLMLFNDVILRVGFELGLNVIDLRLICNQPEDYANPIEPSGPGMPVFISLVSARLVLSLKISSSRYNWASFWRTSGSREAGSRPARGLRACATRASRFRLNIAYKPEPRFARSLASAVMATGQP